MAESSERRNEILLTDDQVLAIARVDRTLRFGPGTATSRDTAQYEAFLDLIIARADEIMNAERAGRRLRIVE